MKSHLKKGKLDFTRVTCARCQGRRCPQCDLSGYTLDLVAKPLTKSALLARARLVAERRPVYHRACDWCLGAYEGHDKRQIYCGALCRVEANRHREKVRHP